MIKVGLIVLLIIAATIFFGAILGVCTDDEYYEEDAFDYEKWEEREK